MAVKAIREYDGKGMLHRHLTSFSDGNVVFNHRMCQVKVPKPTEVGGEHGQIDWGALRAAHPWVDSVPLVVKPDQLIKRRGKAGLLKLNASWEDVQSWVNERAGREIEVDGVRGVLDTFLVEEFVPHSDEDEYYLCIQSNREGEEVLFHHEVRQTAKCGRVDAQLFCPLAAMFRFIFACSNLWFCIM